MQIIDIHSHILYGVDDGAATIDDSIQMLRIAQENAIKKIILTPHNKPQHHNVSPDTMDHLADELCRQISIQGLSIQLFIGNELYYRMDYQQELLEGKARAMADSFYLLVEFNPMDDYSYIRNGIYQILSDGYYPILAHAERYECFVNKPERITELLNQGCYIQINADSVMGDAGYTARKFTRKLLEQNEVHFVASDAHNCKKRSPKLLKCAEFIKKKYGEETANQLFWENPMHILQNEIL